MDYILDKMVKLDILVFKPLSFIMDCPLVSFMLNFTCGKLIVFVMILFLFLHLEKEHCLILNYIYLCCFLWNT